MHDGQSLKNKSQTLTTENAHRKLAHFFLIVEKSPKLRKPGSSAPFFSRSGDQIKAPQIAFCSHSELTARLANYELW